jgi:hypothetical protein
MNSDMWRSLCDEIPPEATPHELETALGHTGAGVLSEDDRAALWLYVWSRSARAQRAAARLRADACSSASPTMVHYLAVLIRANVISPGQRDSRHVWESREPAPVTHPDHASD